MIPCLTNIKNFTEVIKETEEGYNYANDGRSEKNTKIISKLVENVIKYLNDPKIPVNDDDTHYLSQFIEKINIINNQFSEAGQKEVFSDSICELKLLSNQRKSSDSNNLNIYQDPFVSELNNLVKTDSEIKDKSKVARKLYDFQNDKLIPALKSAKTAKEMEALRDIVSDCLFLGGKLSLGENSVDKKGVLKKSKEEIIALWKAKLVQTDDMYTRLISYKKGDIGSLMKEKRRANIVENLNKFISKFVKHSNHFVFSQEDKAAIAKAFYIIHEELKQYQDVKLYPLETLHHSIGLDLPQEKPKASTIKSAEEFKKLKERFEQSSKSESLPLKSSKTQSVKKNQSEEEIRNTVIPRLQKRISNLTLKSSSLIEDIKEIKSDIKKLKNLSFYKEIDFTQLEKMLDLINNPSALRVSREERRFVELLLINHLKLSPEDLDKSPDEIEKSSELREKFKLKEKMLASYDELQELTVGPERLRILQTLIESAKKSGNAIENLLKSAEQVGIGLKERVVKDRFDRFIEKTPALANFKLSTYFPAIVNVFEAFTTIAYQALENKWEKILKHYDGKTQNQFLKLVKNYSYMDPTKQFENFVEVAQEQFFTCLNLQNPLSNSDLENRLQQALLKSESYSVRLFERNYKEMYSKQHRWLVNNYNKIQKSYNQGDDWNTKLQKGVCYANSLRRYFMLIDEPSAIIEMGSNQETRFVQIDYLAQGELVTLGKTTSADRYNKVAKAFGLKRYHSYQLPFQKEDVRHQDLVDKMEQYANVGYTQLILTVRSPNGGHALNIQIDQKNGLFRMMDDNIGLVQFSSIDEFKSEIKEYMIAFYPEYNEYGFESFTKSS